MQAWREGMLGAFDWSAWVLISCSGDALVRWSTLSLAEIAQCAREEFIGEDVFALMDRLFQGALTPEAGQEQATRAALVEMFEHPGSGQTFDVWQASAERWLRCWVLPLMAEVFEQGRIIVFMDVSHQRSVEQARRESDAQLSALIESIPCDIWMCDERGRYVIQNAESMQRWGNQLGKTITKLPIDEGTRARWRARGALAFAGESSRGDVSFVLNEETRTVSEIVAPVRAPNGEIIGVLGVHVDIAPLLEAQQHLDEQRQQTRRMQSALRLTSTIAREFATNLEHMNSATRAAIRAASPQEQDKLLRAVLEEITNASQHNLDLLRLGEPLHSDSMALVALDDLIESALQHTDIPPSIKLSVDVDGLTHTLRADVPELGRLLQHLMRNAIDALPGGGRIIVSSRKLGLRDPYYRHHPWVEPGEWLLLGVQDDGHGMDSQTRARAFEPYFSTRQGHAGLGLAIAYGIAQSHNGHITLESTPAQGTRVDVLLPTS